jgi:D-hydroxyproline dehydrogenase subunit beta
MVAPHYPDPSGSLGPVRTVADVVVIGGGIIGAATAAELAAVGADVVLIERDALASAASGRNHGLLFYPQNPITEPLYRISLEMYRQVAQESPINVFLDERPVGFIILVKDEEDWYPATLEAEACSPGGISFEKLKREELLAEEPNLSPNLMGGVHVRDGLRVDPQALTTAFAYRAREAGAEVIPRTEVKQILIDNGQVTGVATDAGLVTSPEVVLAAGPWCARLAASSGLDLPIWGVRGWLIMTSAAPKLCNHIIGSAGWHLIAGMNGPSRVTVEALSSGALSEPPQMGTLIQQNPSGHVLLGGSRVASIRDEPEDAQAPRRIAERAVGIMPALGRLPVSYVWSGVRPMSPDGLPLIGPVPGVRGLYVCGGHGGQGVILGGGSGKLVTQMLIGAEPFMNAEPFSPGRFFAGPEMGTDPP